MDIHVVEILFGFLSRCLLLQFNFLEGFLLFLLLKRFGRSATFKFVDYSTVHISQMLVLTFLVNGDKQDESKLTFG
jgi:hypothetical protein